MSFPRYPEYKDSGVEWLGGVPAHWNVTALKRGFDVVLGKMLQPERRNDSDRKLPYLRAANIQPGGVDLSDVRKMWFSKSEACQLRLRVGDLLVSEGGDVGRPAIWNITGEYYFQNSINRIRSKRDNQALFLFYWIITMKAKGFIDVLCNKSTIAHFTAEKVAAVPVPFPPSPEQSTIARFLDHETAKIDALIQEQQRLIELLKEKRQAVISHAVTKGLDPSVPMKDSGVEWLGEVPEHWETSRLKYACTHIIDCPHETPAYDPMGEYLVIRTADIERGVLEPAEMYRLLDSDYSHRTRRAELLEGDIVYGREGERWGHAALVPESFRYCLGQRMMQFRTTSAYNPRFLMYHLNADCVYKQGDVDTVGATSPHVNVSTIRNFALTHPPLLEQERISCWLDLEITRIDGLMYEASMAESFLSERRSALISAAVTGKIDVRNWKPPADEHAFDEAHQAGS